MLHKTVSVFLLLMLLPLAVYAQESTPDVDDWEDYRTTLYVRGDQSIIISLGTVFPVIFLDNGGNSVNMNFDSPLGGGGSLAYNYYLSPNVFWGGEFSVQFLSAINGESLFIIPLGARLGYQFSVWKIDIPVSAALGMNWSRYKGDTYFGLFARSGVGAYYRATHSWSFGLTSNWYWLPQWTGTPSENIHGNTMDLFLSARYHF